MNKNQIIILRISRAEKNEAERLAKKNKTTVSKLIRMLLASKSIK